MTPLIVGGSLTDRRAAGLVAIRTRPRMWHIRHTCPRPPSLVDRCLLPSILRRAIRSWTGMSRSSAVVAVAAALGVALLLIGPATWVGVSLTSGAGRRTADGGANGDVWPRAAASAAMVAGRAGFGWRLVAGDGFAGGGFRAMAASAASHQPSAGRATGNLGQATAAVAALAASRRQRRRRACR